MFDSRAKDYFLDDAKYVIRSKWLCTDDILHSWINHRLKLKKILRDKEDSAYYYAQDETAQINIRLGQFTLRVCRVNNSEVITVSVRC